MIYRLTIALVFALFKVVSPKKLVKTARKYKNLLILSLCLLKF